jgi:hypothetical protein
MRRLFLLALAVSSGCLFALPRYASHAASAAGFVYLHQNHVNVNEVSVVQVGADGWLSLVAGSPFTTNQQGYGFFRHGQTIAFSTSKKMVFVTGSGGISAFKAASDGTLTLVPGSPFGSPMFGTGIAVVERGSKTYVYAGDLYHQLLRGFLVQSTGRLTEVKPAKRSSPLTDGVTSAQGMLFVVTGHSVGAYTVKQNGALAPAPHSPFALPTNGVNTLAADPGGAFVYAPDSSAGQIAGFQVTKKNAWLKPLAGSPFSSGTSNLGSGLAISPGPILFALENEGDGIEAEQRGAGGAVTPLGLLQHAGIFGGLHNGVLDSTGQTLIVQGGLTNVVRSFAVNPADGSLTEEDTETVPLDAFVTGMVFGQP